MFKFITISKIRLFFEKSVLQLFFFYVYLNLNFQYSGIGILITRVLRTGVINRSHTVLLGAFL